MMLLAGVAFLILVGGFFHFVLGVGYSLSTAVAMTYSIYAAVYLRLYRTGWKLKGSWRKKMAAVNRWGILAGAGANGLPVWFVHLGLMAPAFAGGYLTGRELGLPLGTRLALGSLIVGIGYVGVGLGHLQCQLVADRADKPNVLGRVEQLSLTNNVPGATPAGPRKEEHHPFRVELEYFG